MTVVREGLQVKVEPIDGLTPKGLIRAAGYVFQCPPLEEFAIDYAFAHSDYDTVNAGQVSHKTGSQLITCQFDTLVVDWGAYTILDEPVEVEEFTKALRVILNSGAPILLTAAHQAPPGGYENWSLTLGGPEIQMPATMRSLTVTEKAGEGDARYLNIAFSEYREPLVSQTGKGKPRKGGKLLPLTGTIVRRFLPGTRTPTLGDGYFKYRPKGSQTITVKGRTATFGDPIPAGVSLADLARHFYSDPSLGRRIAAKNGIKDWGLHTALVLHPRWKNGGKLKIPTKPNPNSFDSVG